MKSKTPMARNIRVNTEVCVWFVKTLTSIKFSSIRKTVPVKIKLVTIRKPPMAMLNLTSFRIHSPQLTARDLRFRIVIIVGNQFNTFARFLNAASRATVM
jgi:hypothetical protein